MAPRVTTMPTKVPSQLLASGSLPKLDDWRMVNVELSMRSMTDLFSLMLPPLATQPQIWYREIG